MNVGLVIGTFEVCMDWMMMVIPAYHMHVSVKNLSIGKPECQMCPHHKSLCGRCHHCRGGAGGNAILYPLPGPVTKCLIASSRTLHPSYQPCCACLIPAGLVHQSQCSGKWGCFICLGTSLPRLTLVHPTMSVPLP